MRAFIVVAFWMAVVSALPAQVAPRRPPAVEELLRNIGLRVAIESGRPQGSREIRLRWRFGPVSGAAAGSSGQDLQFVSHLNRSDPPPLQRSSELSPDHLVIAVVDGQGIVRYSQIIVDPRLIRGEFPDAQGNLHKDVFYRSDVEFSIAVPDNVEAAELLILTPGWEGGLRLSSTAALRLPEAARQ
jgi:hypothetical protein